MNRADRRRRERSMARHPSNAAPALSLVPDLEDDELEYRAWLDHFEAQEPIGTWVLALYPCGCSLPIAVTDPQPLSS